MNGYFQRTNILDYLKSFPLRDVAASTHFSRFVVYFSFRSIYCKSNFQGVQATSSCCTSNLSLLNFNFMSPNFLISFFLILSLDFPLLFSIMTTPHSAPLFLPLARFSLREYDRLFVILQDVECYGSMPLDNE